MQKRGQGAMEFLMTYGWAIVVVLVILSALYFLGVFSPKIVNTCNIAAPFVCNDFFVNNTEVTYLVGAKGISTATVTDIIINEQSCVNDLNGTIQNGNLASDQITQVSCMGIILNPDEKISSEIIIDYSRSGDLPHTISGLGSGVNENSEFSQIPTPPLNNAPTIQLISPSDDAVDVGISVTLTWDGNDVDNDELTYDVYLNDSPYGSCQDISVENCDLTSLLYGTNYDWYVIADDGQNQTQSETWTFTTEQEFLGFPLTGLVFGWAGNDSSDYIGGLGGTAVNGLIPGNNYSIFFDNNATKFDGIDDYIISNLGKSQVGNEFTISMWVNLMGAQSTKGIFQWANSLSSTGPWILFQRTNPTAVRLYLNGGYRITMTANDNNWYHFVLSYDGTTWKAYTNGIESGSYIGSIGINGGNNIYFGNGYNGYFNGTIDEVHIWNRGLSNIEVQELYDYYQS